VSQNAPTGFELRLENWAATVHNMSPAGSATRQAAADLFALLADPGIETMINSIADPTSWEWSWQLGWYDNEYQTLLSSVETVQAAADTAGYAGQAEVGASLLDELSTLAGLADEQVEILADATVGPGSPGSAIAGLLKMLIAFKVIELVSRFR